MNRTVDIVIAGGDGRAVAAALQAIRERCRVLVVCRTSSSALEHLRRRCGAGMLTVMCGAELACVDGVGAPEAVVVRMVRSGKLIGVNTSRLLRFGEPDGRDATSPRAVRLRTPGSRSVESRRRRRGRRSPSPAES